MSDFLIVQLKVDTNNDPKGIYDMLCNPVRGKAPAGRRVRMLTEQALKAAEDGKVTMLSPIGVQLLRERETEKLREAVKTTKTSRNTKVTKEQ